MAKLFLSYGREDKTQAAALAADLADLGHEVWFDKDLTGGQAWWEQILGHIRDCDAFILALSPDSLDSVACRREWGYAIDLRRSLLPVLIADGVSEDTLPPQLAQIHHTDYRKQDKPALMELIKALAGLPPRAPLPDPLPHSPEVPISYLGALREQINAPSGMTFQEQTALAMKLKQGLKSAKEHDSTLDLLRNFRMRDDLFARVADDIDELLKAYVSAASTAQEPSAQANATRAPARGASGSSAGMDPAPTGAGQITSAERLPSALPGVAIDPMLSGLAPMIDRVRACFGPGGRPVLIPRGNDEPVITGRAIEVVRKFLVSDPIASAGAKLLQGVALAVHDSSGAGAATTLLLAHAIYAGGLTELRGNRNPRKVMKAIEATAAACVSALQSLSQPCTVLKDLIQVATRAAHDPNAQIIADAIDKVGKEGVVTIEDGHGLYNELEVVEGMRFDRGFLSPHFVNSSDRRLVVLDDPLVLLCGRKISSAADMAAILEKSRKGNRPMLILAEDVDGEALNTLVASVTTGKLKACAVKSPGFGDRRKAILEDLAILTGAKVVGDESEDDLVKFTVADLGRTRRVEVDQESTTLIDAAGASAEIQTRAKEIRAQIEESTSDYDREKLQERLIRLAGGVAVIKVGAPTEEGRADQRERLETALRAVQAAIEEGMVPGAGHALLRAAEVVANASTDQDVDAGAAIVLRACQEPLRQLIRNAGEDPDKVIDEILKHEGPGHGFNPESGEYEDLLAAGIVDSAKSVRCALESATAASTKLLWASLTP